MKPNHYIYGLLIALNLALMGCSMGKSNHEVFPSDWTNQDGTPRLVVSGHVTNTANEPLSGIAVSVFGVREAQEPDILSYNYALTDSAGRYTIVRYRGRELPVEVTVVATDSSGLYSEQIRICQVTYDSIQTGYSSSSKSPYNAFVSADFVLTSP